MGRSETRNKIQTVLGLIDPEALGITLPREHLLIDMSVWYEEPKEVSNRSLAYQLVSLENLSWVRSNVYNNLDNVVLNDESMAIKEAMQFKNAGGNTIVDLTCGGLGRKPAGLARISRATGLNIIMGTGFYVGAALDFDFTRHLHENTPYILWRHRLRTYLE